MATRSDGWEQGLARCLVDDGVAVHIVGVGNSIRQDDAAGLIAVRRLLRQLGSTPSRHLTIHPESSSPERLLSKLAEGEGRVIVVDAVDAGAEAGGIVLGRLSETSSGYYATHNLPLKLIPGIADRLDAVYLLGIQPAALDVGEGLSPPVEASVDRLVSKIASLVRGEP